MSRQTDRWDKYCLNVARLTANLSYCERLKVGAVATLATRIVCTGFNGTLPGMDNCCEDTIYGKLVTKPTTEHAERNLIGFAAKNGIALLGAHLYITHAPCVECAKMIITSGFSKVIWGEQYRCDSGLQLLREAGISEYQLIERV